MVPDDDLNSTSLTTSVPEVAVWNVSILQENIWAVFDKQFLRHSLEWTVIIVIAYALILVIGIIGNIMVILVVIKRPQMRNVTNMFIMNLVVADLFVIVFCVPATILSNVFKPWILGWIMCKGVSYVQGVSVCASAYSLAAISLDRCIAIHYALERPRGLSKCQAIIIIFIIWVISLVLTIPWAVTFNVVLSSTSGLEFCLETWVNQIYGKLYFLIANFFFCYSLPLILICISNLIVWYHVSHRQVPQDAASAAIIKNVHQRTRHGVRKMLSVVTFTFLISWLPLYVLVTRIKFATNITPTEFNIIIKILPFAQWLGSMNSSINPILYAFLNQKYRVMFKSLLPAWVPFIDRTNQTFIRRYHFGSANAANRVQAAGNTDNARQTFTTSTFTTSTRSSSARNSKQRH